MSTRRCAKKGKTVGGSKLRPRRARFKSRRGIFRCARGLRRLGDEAVDPVHRDGRVGDPQRVEVLPRPPEGNDPDLRFGQQDPCRPGASPRTRLRSANSPPWNGSGRNAAREVRLESAGHRGVPLGERSHQRRAPRRARRDRRARARQGSARASTPRRSCRGRAPRACSQSASAVARASSDHSRWNAVVAAPRRPPQNRSSFVTPSHLIGRSRGWRSTSR